MKKIFYMLAIVFVVPFIFCSCGQNIHQKCKNNLADLRYNYFEAETENWAVSLTSGMRESPYNIDGISSDLVEFTIVTIVPKTSKINIGYAYQVDINEESFEGQFEKSPYDDSYAVDLGVKVEDEDEIYVYINDGQSSEVAKLECISKNFQLTAEDALFLAVDNATTEINTNLKNNFEVYVKIITDVNKQFNDKFWYVLFVDEEDNEITVILDPNSGEIILKKV